MMTGSERSEMNSGVISKLQSAVNETPIVADIERELKDMYADMPQYLIPADSTFT